MSLNHTDLLLHFFFLAAPNSANSAEATRSQFSKAGKAGELAKNIGGRLVATQAGDEQEARASGKLASVANSCGWWLINDKFNRGTA